VLPFIYPPFAALVLSPLALLPWPVAWVAMMVLSLVSLVIVVYVTARRWWTRAATVTAVVFVLHPYHFLPMGDGREQGWSWWEHLIGNAYGLLTVAGLLILAWPATSRWRCRGHAAMP